MWQQSNLHAARKHLVPPGAEAIAEPVGDAPLGGGSTFNVQRSTLNAQRSEFNEPAWLNVERWALNVGAFPILRITSSVNVQNDPEPLVGLRRSFVGP